MTRPRNTIIMGAAGRDFHNFNTLFRGNAEHCVRAFTAHQIPGIAGRTYPKELAGDLYPDGIPIHDESELTTLIRDLDIDEVVFSYSDIRHVDVMHRASIVNAAGADFRLLAASDTMLKSSKPVISVCAVRTGCGKSQTSRAVAAKLRESGKSVIVVRHPMPYGQDLGFQRCERLASYQDLEKYGCTIEEREEYESHIDRGFVVYAGVDYRQILDEAEKEADVILWDGGNNDTPFFRPDLHIVLTDPHRPGHGLTYYPGETNLRIADVILITKIGTAIPEGIAAVEESIAHANPDVPVIKADSVVSVSDPDAVKGRKVLVVEDGPTLTHGEMTYGAGSVAAKKFGAALQVDPRPFAVGSIRDTLEEYPELTDIVPAMGYSDQQVADLEATVNSVDCDLVLVGTPFDLARLIKCNKPVVRVTYDLDDASSASLGEMVGKLLAGK